MLETVQQREHDGAGDRVGRDPIEGIVEVVGLDRHDEQADGRLEPVDGLGMRHVVVSPWTSVARTPRIAATVRSVPTQTAPVRAASIPPMPPTPSTATGCVM